VPSAPGVLLGVLERVSRELDHFFNGVPVAHPQEIAVTDPAGVVLGTLDAADADGIGQLTFQVTQQPQYGHVVVYPNGTYVDTPNQHIPATMLAAGFQDQFTVQVANQGFTLPNLIAELTGRQPGVLVTVPVNDTPGFRAPGAQGLIDTELAGILADPNTVILGGGGLQLPPIPGRYGDWETNAQYFVAQSAMNCVLMATAMVIGQLKGIDKMPTEEQIVEVATSTPSVSKPDRNMYLGLDSEDGVSIKDALKLLEMNGINATLLDDYEKTDGPKALAALTSALGQNRAVMVGVHSYTIWNAIEKKPPPDYVTPNHQVLVLGVEINEDPNQSFVYINDSGYNTFVNGRNLGQNMKVPLDVFMTAWQVDDFETIVAELQKVQSASSSVPKADAA
jgi:VCBS repeat-containing protein